MVAKKKVVKKKPVKKKPEIAPQMPPLMRFKTVAGDEIVAYITAMEDAIVATYPMTVTLYNEGLLVLTPYGLSAKDREVFFFPGEHIVNMYEVDEQFTLLYNTARATNFHTSKEYYDQIVWNSIQMYRKQDARQKSPEGPTDEDLKNIEKEPKNKTVSVAASAEGRTKGDIVDSLVELAEKAGKGKNVK
jgi:hypothetical protein